MVDSKFRGWTIPIHLYSNHRLRYHGYWKVFLHCSTKLMNHHWSIIQGCGPAMVPIVIKFGKRQILIKNALHFSGQSWSLCTGVVSTASKSLQQYYNLETERDWGWGKNFLHPLIKTYVKIPTTINQKPVEYHADLDLHNTKSAWASHHDTEI